MGSYQGFLSRQDEAFDATSVYQATSAPVGSWVPCLGPVSSFTISRFAKRRNYVQ